MPATCASTAQLGESPHISSWRAVRSCCDVILSGTSTKITVVVLIATSVYAAAVTELFDAVLDSTPAMSEEDWLAKELRLRPIDIVTENITGANGGGVDGGRGGDGDGDGGDVGDGKGGSKGKGDCNCDDGGDGGDRTVCTNTLA